VPNPLVPYDMNNQEGIQWCFTCNELHSEWECANNRDYEEYEDLSGLQCMDFVEYLDPIYTIFQKTNMVTSEQIEQKKKILIW